MFNTKNLHKVRKLRDILIHKTVERDGVWHSCFCQFNSLLSPEIFPAIAVWEERCQEMRPNTKFTKELTEFLPFIEEEGLLLFQSIVDHQQRLSWAWTPAYSDLLQSQTKLPRQNSSWFSYRWISLRALFFSHVSPDGIQMLVWNLIRLWFNLITLS